jgi:hypothetical protein
MSSSVSHPDPVMHDFGDSQEDERPDWKHYRATSEAGAERFDPGHAPEVGWRHATPAVV